MFTGIVSGVASIQSVEDKGSFWAISVDLGGFKEGLELGASVSLDGVCLTVVSIDGNIVHFDIIEGRRKSVYNFRLQVSYATCTVSRSVL